MLHYENAVESLLHVVGRKIYRQISFFSGAALRKTLITYDVDAGSLLNFLNPTLLCEELLESVGVSAL